LAGYIVFPATFTGLKDVEVKDENGDMKEAIKKHALDTVRYASFNSFSFFRYSLKFVYMFV
jgi:hypothetical protein